jgi:hypothetical protein
MKFYFKDIILVLFCHNSLSAETPRLRISPFSHIDPGWRRTFDEYYPHVDRIIKSVCVELLVKPSRTFSFEGAAYLTRWVGHPASK